MTNDEPETTDETTTTEPDVDELHARIAELEHRWRTAVADVDNLRKRGIRDAEQRRNQERARIAAEWLPVLDNLDIALTHAQADPSSIVSGVQAVRDQADGVMARLGYARTDDAKGTAFDPAVHEAVSTLEIPGAEPGTIAEVVKPGYGDRNNQLRPATVVVAK